MIWGLTAVFQLIYELRKNWRGRLDRTGIEGSIRGPRGPKKRTWVFWIFLRGAPSGLWHSDSPMFSYGQLRPVLLYNVFACILQWPKGSIFFGNKMIKVLIVHIQLLVFPGHFPDPFSQSFLHSDQPLLLGVLIVVLIVVVSVCRRGHKEQPFIIGLRPR